MESFSYDSEDDIPITDLIKKRKNAEIQASILTSSTIHSNNIHVILTSFCLASKVVTPKVVGIETSKNDNVELGKINNITSTFK